MLFRRFGRPSLLGLAAGTAVVAGTSSMVRGAVEAHEERSSAADPSPVPTTTPAAGPSGGSDMLAELERLGALRQQGLLDDAEFAAAKQRLIAG